MADLKWWETAVIYQIYPRSFQDSNGDGIGVLKGITSRLEYIAELGIDAIWISPFFMSPQRDFGYDISNYCDINPEYGTLADFDEMIARIHGLGMKLMIDIVPAHCSDLHPAEPGGGHDPHGREPDPAPAVRPRVQLGDHVGPPARGAVFPVHQAPGQVDSHLAA